MTGNITLFLVMTHIYTVIKITTSSMYLSNKKPCNCPCLKSTTFSVCQQDKHIITTRTVLSWCCRIRQEDGGRICQTGHPSQPPHPLEQDKRVSYVRKGWEWNFRWMANTFVFKSMFFPFVFKYVLYCLYYILRGCVTLSFYLFKSTFCSCIEALYT